MGIKIDPKKPGCWVASYSKRHPITRIPLTRRRKNLKSKAEALRVEKLLVLEVENALNAKIQPTWEAIVNDYANFRAEEQQSKKTIYNYTLCIKKNTYPKWKFKKINQITTGEIRNLINEVAGSKSVSHQRNLLKFIKGTFNYALEHGYIQYNPTPKIKYKLNSKIKLVLTAKEVSHFLNKAKEYESDWYYHWTMALYTGMRSGELYALTWDKVNFESRSILVNSSWNNKDGFKSTKSGDDRLVEISPNLLFVLKELKLKNIDNKFVLPRLSRWTKGSAAMVTRMFLQGIGLPQVRFHDLRATWATLMLSNGIEPIKVMSMGGWKSLKTMQIYIRKAGVNIKGITNNLDLHEPIKQASKILNLAERSTL